ncbi:MAG: response regulator transcription factor [Xanthomonadaceae bacterium]|jgi:DNA-binding LytR/AlgR family response regulator|nr:response regulator transcription factor [Xanthomonadaceae bacterium]MDE2279663.1 response regulator transcription factor [Xanthomonadaceae bacterium]
MTRAVIAEDELLLRDALSRLLGDAWPELEVIAECENGAEALEAIAAQRPDVAFLDIRMPGLSGLEVAAAAAEASPATQVVFTTAYDQYAVDAFERGAIDYLLKPISAERLAATVERLKRRASAGQAARGDLALLLRELAQGAAQAGTAPPLTWITAGTGRETRLIMVDDVAYFRADHKYTVAVTADGEALLRKPIRELLEQLDPAVFKQIHRSTIVNLKAIAAIVRDDSGKGTVRLRQRPETLTVSQPFMALFRNM